MDYQSVQLSLVLRRGDHNLNCVIHVKSGGNDESEATAELT